MKKLMISGFICVISVFSGFAQGSQSRLETDKVNSAILGVEKNFTVYLPAGYDGSDRDYPVLYLLHGAGDIHTGWVEKGNAKNIADRVIREGMALPVIIIMPDASAEPGKEPGHNMGYFNRPGWNYEDHFFDELMPYVEGKYRIAKEKKSRAVAGLSMGGGGTMVYALHRPDLFSSACPLSGLLGDTRRLNTSVQNDVFRKSVEENDPYEIMKNASDSELQKFRTVRWYIDCGDDDFLYESNVRMYVLMKEKGVPLEYRMRDGVHNWDYWQGSLPEVLRFISIGFAR